MSSSASGKIITFYSYKGGSGRSMTLANVAWVMASNGKRVLVIDWDLEAPGLHKYFYPFLSDKDLKYSDGVIDFVLEYANAVLTPPDFDTGSSDWRIPYANVLRYASSLEFTFPQNGTLDFVPAGRQNDDYSMHVNSFDWKNFYERLGGSTFLELVKERMRSEYDYILIDSRTGVSDTSGICTTKMPDELVVCFTLNNQSIEGAATVAEVIQQIRGNEFRIFPIRTRVESAEKQKLDRAKEYANQRFASLLWHIPIQEQNRYWGRIEVAYQPFYAYEEILATIGDKPGQITSMLASIERITGYLTNHEIIKVESIKEAERLKILEAYASRTSLRKLNKVSPDSQEQQSVPLTTSLVLPPDPVIEQQRDLLDYVWIQKKLQQFGLYSLLEHYARYQDSYASWADLSLTDLYRTLKQSSHILAKDPTQLPYQLLGRLQGNELYEIRLLLSQVNQSFKGIYLYPVSDSLQDVKAFVCTLLGHDDEVTCASFTNDGRYALSGSKDTTIKIWDAQSWQKVRTLRGHTKAVKALCISTDDNYVITASEDKTIKIWEIESGREVVSWIAHKEAVNSVAITSRKPWIISASNDGTIKIWEYSVADPTKPRILYSSSIHPISVNKIAVSPDEKSLFVACGDGSLRVLDISNLEMLDDAPPISLSLQSKNQHFGAVNDIAIARDGKYILSASSDNLLKIWDIENKNEIRTIRGHTNAVKAVKWLPKVQASDTEVQNPDKPSQHEEHVISSSGMGQLRVWDVVTGHSRLILKAHTSGINDLAIERKSKVLITASSDKSLKVWSIKDLFEPTLLTGHKGVITSAKVSSDGRLAISASGDGIVRVWNIAESKKLTEWLAHDDQISDIALTADGKKLLTASWDKRLRLWDVETGRLIRSWEHNPLALSHVTITQDQKEIVYAYTNGEIGIVSLVSNDRPFSFLPHRVQLSALLVSQDGKKIIAAYADQTILKWDRASGTCDWSVSMINGAATSMILTPNGSLLFIGEDDGSISILHTETGDKLRQWGKKHEQAISGLSLSGSKYLISSSIDQTIRVWDIQGQRQLTKFEVGVPLQCSTMSSDSDIIVAGDVLGQVHLFRLENAKL